jgi:predicted GNAT family N-acyltransferase
MHETMQALQGDLYVRKATLEYHGSARYDEQLEIGMRCAASETRRCCSRARCSAATACWCTANWSMSSPTRHTQTSRPVPQSLRDVLQGFEAGQGMVDVRVGGWDDLGREASAIRTEVFVEEQRIPAEMEWDVADASCVHAVAYNRFGLPLATGRLLQHVPGVAKIGRMAVSQSLRGSGVGRHVLEALMKAARARGDREVLLHAQSSAAPFYARAGFAPRGQEFEEAGIPHQEMRISL